MIVFSRTSTKGGVLRGIAAMAYMKSTLQSPLGRDGEAEEARYTEYKLRDDKHEVELGLIDPTIQTCERLRRSVVRNACGEETEQRPDEWPSIRVPGLDLVPEEGRAKEDGG